LVKQVTGETRMFGRLEITAMAQAMAAHAGDRMGLIARNVANADTPGYRAMDLPDFASVYGEEAAMPLRSTRPGHLAGSGTETGWQPVAAPGPAAPDGNSVSLESEMVRAAFTRQEQDMALAIYRHASGVLRTSLGRG
jgi:flagellar basal-body rod protein FlgB